MSNSHREVELRLAIADPSALDAALERAGAQLIGQGIVRTTAFDFPDRRLRAARRTVRLREDWTGLTLTAKEPLSPAESEDAGLAKHRDETNLSLPPDGAAGARRILLLLGLEETLSYEKERRSWTVDNARIDVDVLTDGRGCYAEIEGDPNAIHAVRSLLGLDTAPVEIRSYFEIVLLARGGTA